MKILKKPYMKKTNYDTNDSWKFELISKQKIQDVTKEFKKLVKNEKLNIPKNVNFHNLLDLKQKPKINNYLKISNLKNKNWRPITLKDKTPISFYLGNLSRKPIEIEIVYFINTNLTPFYKFLFKDQLKQLILSKLLQSTTCKLHIVCIRENIKDEKNIIEIIKSSKIKNFCRLELVFKNDEHMEYEGIKKVWDISQSKKEKLIMYFHGKGLSYMRNNFIYIRQPLESFIFKLLINRWEHNLEVLQRFRSIEKLGVLSGGNGWLWFNFWIAKSSYIKKLEKPVKTKRACYYEDWLGRYLIDQRVEKKQIFCEKYLYTINQTASILDNPRKNKYNIGSTCEVGRGGFVGLGLVKFTYKLWYYFYKYLNKILD